MQETASRIADFQASVTPLSWSVNVALVRLPQPLLCTRCCQRDHLVTARSGSIHRVRQVCSRSASRHVLCGPACSRGCRMWSTLADSPPHVGLSPHARAGPLPRPRHSDRRGRKSRSGGRRCWRGHTSIIHRATSVNRQDSEAADLGLERTGIARLLPWVLVSPSPLSPPSATVTLALQP
jgi:hypothetical protein